MRRIIPVLVVLAVCPLVALAIDLPPPVSINWDSGYPSGGSGTINGSGSTTVITCGWIFSPGSVTMNAYPVDGGVTATGTGTLDCQGNWSVQLSGLAAGDYATVGVGSATDCTSTTDVCSEVVTVTVTGQAAGTPPATMKWDAGQPAPLSAERLEAKGTYTLGTGTTVTGKITIAAYPSKGGKAVFVQVDAMNGTFNATFNAPANTYAVIAILPVVQGGIPSLINTPVVTKTTKK